MIVQTLRPADNPVMWERQIATSDDNLWVLKRDVEMGKDRGLTGVPQTVHFHVPDGSREMFPMWEDGLEAFFVALTPNFPTSKLEKICDAFFVIGGKYYQGTPKYPGYLGFGGDTVRCIGTENGMLKIEAVKPRVLPRADIFTSYADYRPGSLLKLPLTTVNGAQTNRFPHNDGKNLFGMLLSDVGYLLIEPERCRKVSMPEFPYR